MQEILIWITEDRRRVFQINVNDYKHLPFNVLYVTIKNVTYEEVMELLDEKTTLERVNNLLSKYI